MIRRRFHKTVGLSIAVLFLIAGAVPASAACPAGCCGMPEGMVDPHAGASRFERQGCCANTGAMFGCHMEDRPEEARQSMAIHAARLIDSPVTAAMIAAADSDLDMVVESAFASSCREGPRAGPVPVFLLNLSLLI